MLEFRTVAFWACASGLVALGLSLLNASTAQADEWPQFMGPHRDGVWRERGILERFPEGGPELLWKREIGGGFSGPAVVENRLFLSDRRSAPIAKKDFDTWKRMKIAGDERVFCLDASTGELLWEHKYDCPYTVATAYANGPRATPTVDVETGFVYALGTEGDLKVLRAENGDVVWSKNFVKTHGLKVPIWGTSSQPLIDGEKLICVVGGEGSVAVAFHKKTGKEIWRALTAKEPGYAPPMIFDVDGERHLIVWHSDAVVGLDPESGEVYWSVALKSKFAMSIVAPTYVPESRSIFVSFYRRGSALLRVGEDRRSAKIVWNGDKTIGIDGVMNPPFIVDGHIYACGLDGMFSCAKIENGKKLWSTFKPFNRDRRVPWGNVFMIQHADRYFLATDLGDLIIARLDTAGYHEIDRAHLIAPTLPVWGRPVVWSYPAFANGRIYLRNDKEIRCFDLRKAK